MSWTCAKCREAHEHVFDTCWRCGTSANGHENPDFAPEQPVEVEPEPARNRPWQFSVAGLFLLTSMIALASAMAGDPEGGLFGIFVFVTILLGVCILINSLYLMVCKLPHDDGDQPRANSHGEQQRESDD